MDGGSSSPASPSPPPRVAISAVEMEEYENWKKNAAVLYDLVISHPLEWPSLTVQWMPSPDSGDRSHRLLLGTHTSDGSPNHLMLADAVLPLPPRLAAAGGGALPAPSVSVRRSVPHKGEVNRARSMPQSPYTVATKTCVDDVHVYHLGDGEKGGADLVLRGHEAEGYGLAWSPMKEGLLLSGSYDKKVCLWDLAAGNGASFLDARHVFEAHDDLVEDVAWHLKDENLFGSVGDDCKLMMWDLRTNKPGQSIVAHQKEVNSLSFNPFNEWILASASGDATIKLFDLRKLSRSLHVFDSHEYDLLAVACVFQSFLCSYLSHCCAPSSPTSLPLCSSIWGEVFQVEWNPNLETVLASSAADKRVMIWDVSRIGDEQAEEDANDGPPELLFVHGGHTAKISELSWNPTQKWVMASVDENNILQIWEMAESIYCDDNYLHDNDESSPAT
uniref:Histone-binding protein RBBP4-like N-terminal domain-containing protein n=1 Tax=Leersia perrieri TaxID=77586 RepID=A0A0D9XG56_9ORYZ